MKRLIILTAAIALLTTACVKQPYADFTSTATVAEVGEPVYFTNRSMDAYNYQWDFDDGYYTSNFNASHSWRTPGLYRVSLSAYGKNDRLDIAVSDIEVKYLYYADLEITVEEYEAPYYLVKDISVRLYPSVLDWEEETNLIIEGYTNQDGYVTFLDVPLPYNRRLYVDVWGPYHDNYQLAAEDAGWIETDVLVPNALNAWTAVVDYYPEGKKAAVDRAELKKFYKLEAEGSNRRKAIEREGLDKGVQEVR